MPCAANVKSKLSPLCREMNSSVEDLVMQQMREHLPMDQQLRVASGYRMFADHFLSQLRQRVHDSGDSSYTVTEKDIRDMMADFKPSHV